MSEYTCDTPPVNCSTSEYFDNDTFTIDIFNRKYAALKGDGTLETPAEAFWRVAKYIASAETDEEKRLAKEQLWFKMMYDRQFFPGGRVFYAAGRSNKSSLINCTSFTLGIDRNGNWLEPDSLEGIYEGAYLVGKVESRGEGVGIDVSKLRPKGVETNNTAVTSTGAVSWMDLFSWTTGTIAQHGRRGALLISIEDWHPDVEEFITIKNTGHDKIQYANISVKMSDEFFQAYEEGTDWTLQWPKNNPTLTKSIPAKRLMRTIAENAYYCAEPGLLYWGTAKRMSNSDAVGFPVIGTNACSEQVLSHGSSCTLTNINLSILSSNIEEACKQMEEWGGEVLHFLDNVVECQLRDNRCPTPVQENDLRCLRRVGVGYTGLGDYLLRVGVAYDSPEAADIAERLTRAMCVGAYRRSAQLAQEKGKYLAYDWEHLKESGFIQHLLESGAMQESELSNGLRNVCCLTIPPVGTGSIMLRTSSGVEPIMDTWYYRRTRVVPEGYPLEWRWSLIVHPMARDIIRERTGIDVELLPTDEEKIETVERELSREHFRAAHEIDWKAKVDLMGRVQKWIDSAISVTYNMDGARSTPRDIEELYVRAWKAGLKGCSVYVQNEQNREPVILFRNKPQTWNFSDEFVREQGSPYAL